MPASARRRASWRRQASRGSRAVVIRSPVTSARCARVSLAMSTARASSRSLKKRTEMDVGQLHQAQTVEILRQVRKHQVLFPQRKIESLDENAVARDQRRERTAARPEWCAGTLCAPGCVRIAPAATSREINDRRHQKYRKERPGQRSVRAPSRPPGGEVSVHPGEPEQEPEHQKRPRRRARRRRSPSARATDRTRRGSPQEQSRAGGLHQDNRREQDQIRKVPDVQETDEARVFILSAGSVRFAITGHSATIRKCL